MSLIPEEKPKSKKLRNAVIAIWSIIALLAVALGTSIFILKSSYDEVEKVSFRPEPTSNTPSKKPTKEEEKDGSALNILLIGSDSRDTTDTSVSADRMTGYRSDAIMVAQISPDREHVTVMSIMRDNWVYIDGFGEAKINAAFSYGGPPLAMSTIEEFIGAPIDHAAIVDFQSFKGLTDAVGGVTINNQHAFQSSHNRARFFDEGEITLNGDDALAFVRERYAFSDGDYQRVRNQQAYMKGLLKSILSKETLTDPKKITGTFDALKPYLIVDDELTLTKMVKLAAGIKDLRSDDITFFTSPTNGTGSSADGQSIVLPNWAELENVRAHFAAGTLHEYDPVAPY